MTAVPNWQGSNQYSLSFHAHVSERLELVRKVSGGMHKQTKATRAGMNGSLCSETHNTGDL